MPFEKAAEFFSSICRALIIEFVPKTDSGVEKLLTVREDISDKYDRDNFEKDFSRYFYIVESREMRDSGRVLYFMKKEK